MKSLLMILFFTTGFAINGIDAQCCVPCPPECLKACTPASKGSAASINEQPVGVASLASFSPEVLTAACSPEKMSNKDTKACKALCTGKVASVTPAATSVNGQQACTPTPANQVKVVSVATPAPACTSKPIKQ